MLLIVVYAIGTVFGVVSGMILRLRLGLQALPYQQLMKIAKINK
jgi:hypothetical protein